MAILKDCWGLSVTESRNDSGLALPEVTWGTPSLHSPQKPLVSLGHLGVFQVPPAGVAPGLGLPEITRKHMESAISSGAAEVT